MMRVLVYVHLQGYGEISPKGVCSAMRYIETYCKAIFNISAVALLDWALKEDIITVIVAILQSQVLLMYTLAYVFVVVVDYVI